MIQKDNRPKNYSYSLSVIQLCIAFKLQSSASFRAIREIIIAINIYLQISIKAPTHSTVLLWMKKYGYYELIKPKLNGEDWIVILDESVQVGQNRLLVIYGIRQCNINFSRPLNYQDLSPLVLKSRSSWDSQHIKEMLLDCQKQVGGSIIYAVADHGNSINKALKLMKIPHVYDLTHCIALALEHIYRDDPEFKEYTEKLTYLRKSQVLGKMSHVLPPLQRAKSRFMNLRPISDWGMNVLNLFDKSSDDQSSENFHDEKNHLTWVKDYRVFIKELALLNKMINDIEFILKREGLSIQTADKCIEILKQSNTKRLINFRDLMIEYIKETLERLPKTDKILCSSDILESSFGKYKNYLQDNPMVGITNLCLSIAAFTGTLASNEMREAFENTTVRDIDRWTKSNIGKTTLAKRIEVFKKWV